jgi:hypothetical protein
MGRTVASFAIGAVLVVAVVVVSRQGPVPPPVIDALAAEPHPGFTPAQVVRIQLSALRRNGPDDAGIAACFRFASPANQQQTGPLERFARLIADGPYSIMLRYQSIRYGQLRIDGDSAEQAVILVDHDGTPAAFLFTLSRQIDPPYVGCWMTDSVSQLPAPPADLVPGVPPLKRL